MLVTKRVKTQQIFDCKILKLGGIIAKWLMQSAEPPSPQKMDGLLPIFQDKIFHSSGTYGVISLLFGVSSYYQGQSRKSETKNENRIQRCLKHHFHLGFVIFYRMFYS